MLKRKVGRTKSAGSEGTAAAGTLRVGDFLRMRQKQGEVLGGSHWEIRVRS